MTILATFKSLPEAVQAKEERSAKDPLEAEYFVFDEGRYFVLAVEPRDEPSALYDCGD